MDFSKYDYVSFDIFDTLIVRNVLKPEDVFLIVESKYNSLNKKKISNFKINRLLAQRKASLNNNEMEEADINLIYKELENYYSKDICRKLLALEKEVEINVCVRNNNIINDYYAKASSLGKKIIITSDMYLDEETIIKILKKNNIKYYKLYLSSKYNKRKSSGTLFDYILKDLNISPTKIIHIGDNIISDYLRPKQKKIKAIRIKNKSNNSFYNKKIKTNEYKLLEKFISNNIDINDDYYFNMGYETFGPILYGFANYLKENIKNKDKMFFLSRDGYLISKAYRLIDKESKTNYFYASRRALIVPTLWLCDNLKEMTDKLYIRDYIKVGNLFRKLGLEKKEYQEIVEKHGYSLEQEVKYEDLFKEKFTLLFEEIKPLIHKNSKKEYDLLLQYMKQEGFDSSSSIIDIGWNGNMQMAFNNVIKASKQNIKVDGYYVGVLKESKNIGKIKMNGFLFDEVKNDDIYICLKVINSIFESMFLAPHGSVKTYKKVKDKIEPVLLDYEYKEGTEKNSYEKIQEGALKFIVDFTNSDLKYILKIDERLSFYNMMKFAYHPTLKDVEKFGDFKFLEDDIIYLAKPKKISYYLRKPKTFFKDLYLSGWIIGFLKRLTKINLFYEQLYKVYIRIYLNKRQKKLGDKE